MDTNVFIKFEKSGNPIDFSSWESSQKFYVSVVVVSELLMRVHRANTEARRQRRSARRLMICTPASIAENLDGRHE